MSNHTDSNEQQAPERIWIDAAPHLIADATRHIYVEPPPPHFRDFNSVEYVRANLASRAHPFGPCGYEFCDWPDGELRCNEPRASLAAVGGDDDGSADWCDDCHGYTHKYDCPSKRSEAKTPLVDRLVNAVYRSMAKYEDGTWFLDNLKAKARVGRLLAAASSPAPSEPPNHEGERK